MPETEVLIYAEDDDSAPLVGWLDGLPPKVQDKCIVRIERLGQMGHELRRPEEDALRDGIRELRIRFRREHYRILYFFSGELAVLSHGIKKEGEVPPREIDLALERKRRFESDPDKHTYRE